VRCTWTRATHASSLLALHAGRSWGDRERQRRSVMNEDLHMYIAPCINSPVSTAHKYHRTRAGNRTQ